MKSIARHSLKLHILGFQLALAPCFCAVGVHAQSSFYLSFTPPTNAVAAGVVHYDAWWQITNAPDLNQHAWFGQCPAGQTNIDIPGSLPNPVLIFATSSTSNQTSAFSGPFLFDTNDFPPARVLSPLLPPSGLVFHVRQ